MGTKLRVPDNLDVTLTGVTLSKGDDITTPKPGNEFAITYWTFHNFRSDNTDVADTGFQVASGGVITNADSFNSLSNNALDMSGSTLAPGGTLRRDIEFEIAKGTPARIVYQPSDTKATWNING